MSGKIELKDINALDSDTICAVVGSRMLQNEQEICFKYTLYVALKNTTDKMSVNLPVHIGMKKGNRLVDALKSAPFPIVSVSFKNLQIRKFNLNGKELYSGTASDFTIQEAKNNKKMGGVSNNEKNNKQGNN